MAKRKPARRNKSQQPKDPNQEGVMQASRSITETRPAQLTPEIIEKFNNDHIDKLVKSFVDSVEYQNTSDREAMIKHYSYLSGKDNKTTIAGTIMFLATLSAYTFSDKIPETIALPLLIAEVALILAPQVFSKILSLFTFSNARKKLPKD